MTDDQSVNCCIFGIPDGTVLGTVLHSTTPCCKILSNIFDPMDLMRGKSYSQLLEGYICLFIPEIGRSPHQ